MGVQIQEQTVAAGPMLLGKAHSRRTVPRGKSASKARTDPWTAYASAVETAQARRGARGRWARDGLLAGVSGHESEFLQDMEAQRREHETAVRIETVDSGGADLARDHSVDAEWSTCLAWLATLVCGASEARSCGEVSYPSSAVNALAVPRFRC